MSDKAVDPVKQTRNLKNCLSDYHYSIYRTPVLILIKLYLLLVNIIKNGFGFR